MRQTIETRAPDEFELAHRGAWLAANPGGRLVPVRPFHDWMQRVFPRPEETR